MFRISIAIIKTIICVVILNVTTQISFAQSYFHTPNDSIVANAIFDDVSVFNIIQNHPTNDTLYFKWKKHFVSLPASWEANICDVGHCYTTIVDSSTCDPIYPGDNGLMSLHLNPHFEAGTGIVQVLFWETNTPTQIDTLTWIITATGSLGINEIGYENIKLYPNPSNKIIKIETDFENGFTLRVLTSEGKLIETKTHNQKNIEYDISPFTNGIYELQLVHNKQILHKRIIKQ